MKNSSVTMQITVNPETLAEIDLLSLRLSLISGVDWDIHGHLINCFPTDIKAVEGIQSQLRAGVN